MSFKKDDFDTSSDDGFVKSIEADVKPFSFFSFGGSAEKEVTEEVVEEIDVEAITQEAYQKGLAEGENKAEKFAHEKIEALTSELQQGLAEIREQLATHVATVEKEAVELSLIVSKRVLEATAEVNPEYIFEVVRKALSQVEEGSRIKISLSEQDYEFLDVVGFPPELTDGVEYVVDENIQSGCKVETEFGKLDMRLEAMWEALHRRIVGEG